MTVTVQRVWEVLSRDCHIHVYGKVFFSSVVSSDHLAFIIKDTVTIFSPRGEVERIRVQRGSSHSLQCGLACPFYLLPSFDGNRNKVCPSSVAQPVCLYLSCLMGIQPCVHLGIRWNPVAC